MQHEILAVKKFDSSLDVRFEAPDSEEAIAFIVQTMDGGYTFGREYCFRVSANDKCQEWIKTLEELSKSSATSVGYQRKVEEWKVKPQY